MSDRTLVGLLRVAAVAGGALVLTGSAMIISTGHAGARGTVDVAFVALFALFFAVFAWLVIPRQPRNAVVWTMVTAAFFGGLFLAGQGTAALVVDDPTLVLGGSETLVPADHPAAAAWIRMFTDPAIIASFFPLLTFGLLLFPDGRLPSPRWRWVGWLAGVGILATMFAFGWGFRPANDLPADESNSLDNAFVLILIAVIASLVALVVRFRRSSGATRQQFKWVVWGAAVFAPVFVFVVILGGTQYQDLAAVPFFITGAIFLGSYGIAVGR